MQPHLQTRYKADVAVFDNIQGGDYFFLCCDGILEQFSNEELCSILASPTLSDEEKIGKIKEVCDGKTRDNYSCWLVPIESVSFSSKSQQDDIIIADAEESLEPIIDEGLPEIYANPSPEPRKRWLLKIMTIAFAVVAILWCGYFAYTYLKGHKNVKHPENAFIEKNNEDRKEATEDNDTINGKDTTIKIVIPYKPDYYPDSNAEE